MRAINFRSVLTVAVALSAAAVFAAPTKTLENLKAAYVGETTAQSKYIQYARVARREGRQGESTLFAAAAKAEAIHARNHKSVLHAYGVSVTPARFDGKVGKTAANVQAALKGETYERDVMYPEFIATARSEGATDAVETFSFALAAERRHAELYGNAASTERAGKAVAAVTYFVCPRCGETFPANAPPNCPVCGTDRSKMIEVK